ncbi:N-acetyltransferase [Elusimicrobiota bacterium]
MKIRSAKVTDAKTIHALIRHYAEKKEMLHRPINDIYENIQGFAVCEDNDKVVACAGLYIAWEDLAEIKALVVDESYQKKGIGKKLIAFLESRAKELKIAKIFALTFKPPFFEKNNYKVISKEVLPHKIWGECVKCHLFPDCGETPLMKIL